MRRVLVSVLTTAVLLLLTAQAALAAKPVHLKDRFTDEFEEDLCGIPVTTVVETKVNVIERADGTFKDVSQVRITWTNAEGDTLENFIAGPVFIEAIENPDGTLTIIQRHAGIHERLRSSQGLTPAFDRGQIVFMVTIDFGADPDDPDDDLVTFETLFVAGPHPEFESDFALFCEVVTDVLG